MNRIPFTACSLALALALAGCGSTAGSSSPMGNLESARASAAAQRQLKAETALQQQISPALDAPLQVLEFADPRYPSHLISDYSPDAHGEVTVSFEVMPSGQVGATRVLPGSNEALHKPAVDAIRRWRFAPPVRDGKPARLYLQHTFRVEP